MDIYARQTNGNAFHHSNQFTTSLEAESYISKLIAAKIYQTNIGNIPGNFAITPTISSLVKGDFIKPHKVSMKMRGQSSSLDTKDMQPQDVFSIILRVSYFIINVPN
jgi:hypothetical protein